MLTEQMKKDLDNPEDVIDITTSSLANIKAVLYKGIYLIATSHLDAIDPYGFRPTTWVFCSKSLRETAAVFNALADTLDRQNGEKNGRN